MANREGTQRLRRIIVATASAAVVATGVGFGVAHAVERSASPVQNSVDRLEPGDRPDSGNDHESAGRSDVPEPGDTPDTQR